MEYEMGFQLADDGMDKQRKKSAIRKKAIRFTKIISLVGLRHATDTRNSTPRRFVWVGWVVFGVLLAIYQIQDRIVYYRQYPSSTEVKFNTDELSLLLPQVTICDDLDAPYGQDADMISLRNQIDEELKNMKDAETKNEEHKRITAINKMRALLSSLHNKTWNWDELSKSLSRTAVDVIQKVRFRNHENRSIIEEVKTELGHCFAFSTEKKPLISTKGGAPNGLFLELEAPKTSDKSVGFKLLIHDSLVIPKINHNGITLRPGTATRVTVSYEDVTYLGPPYDRCNTSDPNYRQATCLTTCEYEVFLSQCKCRDIHMPGKDRICSYANILDCTKIFGSQVNASANSSMPNKCICGPTCHSRNYKTSITQTALPLYENIVDVYVYYQHIAYMEVKNGVAYSFLQLLCDIGGALSLLLGATLLTVYEAVEFFLLFLKDYLHLRFAK